MSKVPPPPGFQTELEYLEATLGIHISENQYELNEEGRLIELNLSHSELEDISFLSNLKSLERLDLSQNPINNIYFISKVNSLKRLKLSHNGLRDISFLSKLRDLKKLDLSYNQISNVNAISKLRSLQELNLSRNEVKNINPLAKMDSLIELDLALNQIVDISPLKGLTSLTDLDLFGNNIDDISELTSLISLKRINISKNSFSNLKALSKLTSLTNLYTHSNGITNIDSLSSLTSLKVLVLNLNKITDITALSKLTSLEELRLEVNRIEDINPIANLRSLKSLHLSTNKLRDIGALSKLNSLKELSLYENPIENIPETILKSSAQEIIRWLQENSKQEEKKHLKDVKVLLLGNTNIGKSNLLHLWKQRCNIEAATEYPEDSDSTHGLVYEELKKEQKHPLLHIWDFGGQEYFHATHQLFFSPDALHVLLWSKIPPITRVKGEEVFELDYWLRCAEQLSRGDSPIEMVLVENRIDHKDEKEKIDFYTHFPENCYLDKFNIHTPHQQSDSPEKPPIMMNACAVSLKYKKRLEGMFELLEERIDMLYQKNVYPPIYAEIRDTLAKSRKKIWTLAEYKRKFNENDGVILQTLHSAGCLLYFHKQLPNKVFTKPDLLLDLIYTEILNEELKKNRGKLHHELQNAAANNELKLNKNELQSLLSSFKLIFQTKDQSWYAPQYLPEQPPMWLNLLKEYTFGFANIILSSDHYLMNSILLDIFQEYGSKIKENEDASYMFWQKGLVIEKDDQLLLVKYDRKQMRLLLYGDQQEKNKKLQQEIVHFILETINASEKPNYEVVSKSDKLGWKGERDYILKPKGVDPGNRKSDWNSEKVTVSVSIDGKYYVDVNQLNENVANKVYSIQAFAYEDETLFKTFSVFQFNQYLAERDKGKMKKVAISYSKDDLKLVNEFIKNLVPLHDDGLIEDPWYCSQLEVGSDWNKEIQDKFKQADIIFFMVSPNFLATKYIKEHEIRTAIARREKEIEDNIQSNKQLKIIPIILDFCRWDRKDAKYNLGKYTALPYKAKPVADFKNKNMAWYIIEEAIRTAIELDNDPEFSTKLSKSVRRIYERIVEGKVDDDNE